MKLVVPPLNFAPVVGDVYRSGHPLEINYPFLERLHVKTVIYLGDRSAEDNQAYREWMASHNIKFVQLHVENVKEPFVQNNEKAITEGLEILLDVRNFPVLVHSNKGKHRVGVLVGVMRKMLLGWSLAAIFDDYSKFAGGKGEADLEFIELFSPTLQYDENHAPAWLRNKGQPIET